MDIYTVAQASQATQIAKPTIRAYTNRYERYLSTEATPEHGSERLFTLSDLRVLAFVKSYTSSSKTHEQALQALEAGELESFEWLPPDEPEEPPQATESASEALIPLSQLDSALERFVASSQQREQEAQAQISELQAKVERLTQELGRAQGELTGVQSSKYRAPGWWRAIFGGESE